MITSLLKAELLKLKRTFAVKLVLLAPLTFVLIALPQRLLMPPGNHIRPWELLVALIFNWWPLIFIPIGLALYAALVETQERKAGHYRNVRVRPVSQRKVWTAKIMAMAIYSMLASCVLIVSVLLSGLISAGGEIPLRSIVAGGFAAWVALLGLLPLQLWAAAWKGTFFSLGLGMFGLVAGVVAAPTSAWLFVPWSWPIRLMCPIVGVHPNGVLLDTGDPLRNASVIPIGIALSLALCVLLTVITASWFARKEMK